MEEKRRRTNRNLIILHSNDLHADFVANEEETRIVGGFPYLSGYVKYTREKHPKSTMYMLAGDLFSGNLIDYEFKGEKSIELLNKIGADVTCIGNHSMDHKVQQLSFLEKLCACPIICANLYTKYTNRPFFQPYVELQKNGVKILVIGLVTEEVMRRARKDEKLGVHLEWKDPMFALEQVFAKVNPDDYDLRIILSHLGHKDDKKLAEAINELNNNQYGIDLMIGGHSHHITKQVYQYGNIKYVQVGKNSKQIGQFQLTVDTSTHKIKDWRWDCLPIDNGHGNWMDEDMDLVVTDYHKYILKKFKEVLVVWDKQLIKEEAKLGKDENRFKENVVGDFFADVLLEIFSKENVEANSKNHNEDEKKNTDYIDVCLIGSGSLRTDSLGPALTRLQLRNMYSVNELFFKVDMTGKQLKSAMEFAFDHAPTDPKEEGEYYQVDKGCKFWYDGSKNPGERLIVAEACGQPIEDDRIYHVGLEDYHFYNMEDFLGIKEEEVPEPVALTADTNLAIEDYLREHKDFKPVFEVEERTKRIGL